MVAASSEIGSIINGELLGRTNLFALVGGGAIPKYADNTVLIYDDTLEKFIMEITVNGPVLAVRLKNDK